jgi:DNA-binding Lrp family transcriptional regulator
MRVTAYILIQTEVGIIARVAEEIRNVKGVESVDEVTGPYDIIVRAEASNLDLLGKLVVRNIQGIDGVVRTLTCPIIHL